MPPYIVSLSTVYSPKGEAGVAVVLDAFLKRHHTHSATLVGKTADTQTDRSGNTRCGHIHRYRVNGRDQANAMHSIACNAQVGVSFEAEAVPVLEAGVIYLGDNGQRICLKCAGASAKYSGHDISGQPVYRMTLADAQEWKDATGKLLNCEAGCTEFQTP